MEVRVICVKLGNNFFLYGPDGIPFCGDDDPKRLGEYLKKHGYSERSVVVLENAAPINSEEKEMIMEQLK